MTPLPPRSGFTAWLRSPYRPCRWHRRRTGAIVAQIGNGGFGRDQQPCNRGGILKRGAHDLGGIDDAGLEQILILLGLRVEAEILVITIDKPARDHAAVMTGIFRDLRSEEPTSELQSLMRHSYAV